MALSEFERKKAEKEIDAFMDLRRPPSHIRSQVDIGYRISGQSIELFEIRPLWNEPNQKMEEPFAKATYVRTKNIWKIYWMRRDLKWHTYEPAVQVGSVKEFLAIVNEDNYRCFFG
jgi:hypothetical protein